MERIEAHQLRAGMTLRHQGREVSLDVVQFIPNNNPTEVRVSGGCGRDRFSFRAYEMVEIVARSKGWRTGARS